MKSSKTKMFFQCQSCGYRALKWLGKCPDCGSWNSFVEEKEEKKALLRIGGDSKPVALPDITVNENERIDTGINELNRILGGGIVGGSLVLIGGDPGIGKSTIILQMLDGICKAKKNASDKAVPGPALYVSGEESLKQIKLRASRLNIDNEKINVLAETCIENITEHAKEVCPSVLVIDSIQTVFTQEITSAPGSVAQVRESAAKLMIYAKSYNVPVFIVGHVTKEGAIAGPRILEHIVDTVLYFEGTGGHSYRILRAVKNRFGSTNEIGVFEMRELGLIEIPNPSELFLAERPDSVAGTTVVSTMEGTRPLMVEVQALVSQTNLGIPRRTAIGVDVNRVNLLVAVLEKIGGLSLGGMDIFLNITGGLKVTEPAIDLGIVGTIVSSFKDIPINDRIFVFGEVGLSGEVRAVSRVENRINEAEKIGFKEALIPMSNVERLNIKPKIKITGVSNINEAIQSLFPR